MEESRDQLREELGLKTSYLRLRAYPFTPEVEAFITVHDRVYVVEQNRDAQMLSLLRMDLDPTLLRKLRSVAPLQRPADRRAEHYRRRDRNRRSEPSLTRDNEHRDSDTRQADQPHQPRRQRPIEAARRRSARAADTTPSRSASSTPSSRWAWTPSA